MNKKKLRKIEGEIQGCRGRGGIKPIELESIAHALGRVRSKKGDEPTYISIPFPGLFPLSIPHHSNLNRYTAGKILDQLELDVDRWKQEIESEE